ncbi:MAG TPA: hypothetical protein VE863_02885 [Pyrinomonadaceae bacterium]|jgi:hypothetical protein|nr:hypothetical protein [Pyrinomonadaceae bacterium]
MILKIVSLACALLMIGAILAVPGGNNPQVVQAYLAPRPDPSPTRVGNSELRLETVQKLGEAFKKTYGLAAPPDMRSISQVLLSTSQTGDSAKGVVMLEKSGELYLDTTPCETDWDKKQVHTFNQPYTQESTDDQSCSSTKSYKMKKVTQQ